MGTTHNNYIARQIRCVETVLDEIGFSKRSACWERHLLSCYGVKWGTITPDNMMFFSRLNCMQVLNCRKDWIQTESFLCLIIINQWFSFQVLQGIARSLQRVSWHRTSFKILSMSLHRSFLRLCHLPEPVQQQLVSCHGRTFAILVTFVSLRWSYFETLP